MNPVTFWYTLCVLCFGGGRKMNSLKDIDKFTGNCMGFLVDDVAEFTTFQWFIHFACS